MHDFPRTVLAFILILGILVFIHELGHYLAARWRGVKVDVFSIGFGPVLYRWSDRSGTEWRLSAIPLGGFVKPHGFENPYEATEEQKASWIAGRTFHDKPVGSRMLVIVMGPVFNFLFAMIVFTVLFAAIGRPEVKPDVSMVVSGSAADRAGVKPGDTIIRINGHAVLGVSDIQNDIAAHPGEAATLGLKRDGRTLDLPVTLDRLKQGDKFVGRLGVGFTAATGAPLPLGRAALAGVNQTWQVSGQILQGVWQIVSGQRSVHELGGTIRIAQMSGQVAKYGLASILSFMALLSINLGLINLFPIPVLDGGRLLFYCVEVLQGRPVSQRMQEIGMQAGILLIAALFLLSTFNDLSSLGLFHWLAMIAH